jgi:single-stranded-DNA-specific exonuclease
MDHHVPPNEYPEGSIILNPKMENEGYPFRELSAGGVILKFIHGFALSHTKNHNRTFVPIVIRGERILGRRVKNGIPLEKFEFEESINYPIKESDVVVTDTTTTPPDYFVKWLKDKKIRQLSIVGTKSCHSLDEFVDVFISVFTRKQKKTTRFLRSFIDLAAISTISDIMPLADENRVIVKEGLKQIPHTENMGLRVLLGYCDLPDHPLTARDIAWNLAPIVNAAGRMGSAIKAVNLFTTTDVGAANELARMLIEFNQQRKEKGERNLSIIGPMVETECYKDPVIVLSTDRAEHGVTGIIASRISKRFSKPAIIIVNDGIIGVGSGRGSGNVDLVSLVTRCDDLLMKYGGHKSAVGFTIETGNIDEFRERIQRIVKSDVDLYSFRPTIDIDDTIEPRDVADQFFEKLMVFEPTGIGNRPPRFAILGTTVTNPNCIGKNKNHVKFHIPSGGGMVQVIGWNMADKCLRIIEDSARVDIVFTIEENFYRNERSLQLTLLDIRSAA